MNYNGVYLDLFDDGIPKKNLLVESVEPGSLEARLANTARFQILLCLLFGRSVIVPEAWLISSATFLRIAQEIEEYYSLELEERDAIGRVYKPTPPVFQVSFLDDEPAPLTTKYLLAFARRLEENRRIECLTGVLQAQSEIAKDQRRHLAAFMRKQIPRSDTLAMSIDRFQADLNELLSSMSAGPEASLRAWSASRAISGVLRYLAAKPADILALTWGKDGECRYRTHAATQVALVHKVVDWMGDKSNYTTEVEAFKFFFDNVRAANVQFADIMGMQQLLAKFDPPMAKIIRAFGRYVLNRGYAMGVQSSLAGVSFKFYAQGENSEFYNELMGSILNRERKTTEVEFPGFLELTYGHEYDLADSIDWPATWKACAAVVNNPMWTKKRDEISNFVMNHSHPKQLDDALLEELFDQVNGSFLDFRFKFSGGEGCVVSQAKKVIAFAKENITSDSLTVVANMTEDVAKIAGIAAPSVAALLVRLLGHVPGTTLVKTERHLRRLGRLHGTEVDLQSTAANLLRW